MRRRVYDSLNVLYAVGVLQKGKNKQVFCSPEYDLRHRQQQAQREVEHLELQNLEGQKRLLKKKKELA